MPLTPDELRQLELRRRAGGYERESVDRVVEYMRQNYDEVWRERERLQEEVSSYREVDAVLRRTLVSAQRTADELLAEAERDGQALVEQAQKKALEVLGGIEGERDRLEAEVDRLQALVTEVRASYRDFLVASMELLENDEVTEEHWVFRSAETAPEDDDDDDGEADARSQAAGEEAAAQSPTGSSQIGEGGQAAGEEQAAGRSQAADDEPGARRQAAGSANGGDSSKDGD